MFEVRHSGGSYVCTLNISGKKTSLVELTGMKCRVEVPLGAAGKTPAAKTLLPEFTKTLNTFYARKSAPAVDKLIRKADFLSDTLKKGGRTSNLEQELRRDIDVIWPRMCTKLLPRLADEALLTAINATKDGDAKAITQTKKAAAGKAEISPVLKITAAAIGVAASPGALVAVAALLSVWSAYKDDMKRIDVEIGHLDLSNKAAEADVKALKDAVGRIGQRVEAIRKAQDGVAKAVMAAAASERQIEREISALEKAAGNQASREIGKLKAPLEACRKSSEGLTAQMRSVDGLSRAATMLQKATESTSEEVAKMRTDVGRGATLSKKVIDIAAQSTKIAGAIVRIFKY